MAVTVTVTPIFDPAVEGPETVIFTAEGTTATATIADEPAASLVGRWGGTTAQGQFVTIDVGNDGITRVQTAIQYFAGLCAGIADVLLTPIPPSPITNNSFTVNFSFIGIGGSGSISGTFGPGASAAGTLSATVLPGGCPPTTVNTTWTATKLP